MPIDRALVLGLVQSSCGSLIASSSFPSPFSAAKLTAATSSDLVPHSLSSVRIEKKFKFKTSAPILSFKQENVQADLSESKCL